MRRRYRPRSTRRRQPWLAVAAGATTSLLLLLATVVAFVSLGAKAATASVITGVAATAIFASATYFLFWVRVRISAATTYLGSAVARPADLWRRPPKLLGYADLPERRRLARAIARDLIKPSLVEGVVLVADAGCGRSSFLTLVAQALAREGILPVVVEAHNLSALQGIEASAQEQLRLLLTAHEQGGDEAARLWRHMLRRGRLALLIDGLDARATRQPYSERREEIQGALDVLARRGIPYVTCLPTGLCPARDATASIPLAKLPPDAMRRFFVERLTSQGVGSVDAAREVADRLLCYPRDFYDPYLLELGARATTQAATLPTSERRLAREVTWMCRAADIDFLRSMETPTSLCVTAIGRVSLFLGREVVTWSDVHNAVAPGSDSELLLRGRGMLEQQGILRVVDSVGGEAVVFAHPALLALSSGRAVAVDEDADAWQALLRQAPSEGVLAAFSMACLRLALLRPSMCLREIAHLVRLSAVPPEWRFTWYVAAYEGLAAASTNGAGLDEEITRICDELWKEAPAESKLWLLRILDLRATPMLTAHLWSQLVPPRFFDNEYPVRREIDRCFADAADASWETLGTLWRQLCGEAAEADLSRRGAEAADWRAYGSAVGSLCWVLPSLLVSCRVEENRRATADLLSVLIDMMLPGSCDGKALPDVGLEISLAEGLKFALVDFSRDDHSISAMLRTLLAEGRGWTTRLIATQGLVVYSTEAGADEGSEIGELLRATADDTSEHPLVREAAALGAEVALRKGEAHNLDDFLWTDDVAALASGGVGLSQRALRLLAITTLLLNIGEERGKVLSTGGRMVRDPVPVDDTAGQLRRSAMLVADRTPACLRTSEGARRITSGPCSCEFGLCGRPRAGLEGPRKASDLFWRRAAAAAVALRLRGIVSRSHVRMPADLARYFDTLAASIRESGQTRGR